MNAFWIPIDVAERARESGAHNARAPGFSQID
jgi:hypothetical protein